MAVITVREALKKYVVPLRNQVIKQQQAIKFLSKQVQEAQARTGSMKLDISAVKDNATARPHVVQEALTTKISTTEIPRNPIHDSVFAQEKARHEIVEMDNLIRGKQPNPYQ